MRTWGINCLALTSESALQERYLGDVHDFMKYALLRHLHEKLNMSIGVNWYLTEPSTVDSSTNNDGNQRYHLAGKTFAAIDAKLLEALNHFNDKKQRKLSTFEGAGILPSDTVFHAEEVPVIGRDNWHQTALKKLTNSDLIFLDPDNGLVVPSASSRKIPKYARYEEIQDYLAAGKTVVSIQFARQCDPVRRAREIRAKIQQILHEDANLPVVRCRVSPNILFLFSAPTNQNNDLSDALRSFSMKDQKRIELIF